MRTKEGSDAHNLLIEQAKAKLEADGWTVAKFTRLPGRGVTDLYAEKNGDKIVVEALLYPSSTIIFTKKEKWADYAKLIIAIPEGYRTVKEKEVEVWKFPITLEDNVVVKLTEETHKHLKVAAAKKGKDIRDLADELMRKALKAEGLWLND